MTTVKILFASAKPLAIADCQGEFRGPIIKLYKDYTKDSFLVNDTTLSDNPLQSSNLS